jgi:putative acetyltransferase
MRPAIDIRHAEVADAAAMAAYMAALMAEAPDTISRRPDPSVDEERAWITATAADDRALILVATCGQAVIGLLDLSADERPAYRHAARFGMSVGRAWRGQGVGRRLLQAAIAEARAWPGLCRIELECVPWNAAGLALYERLGFRIEARKAKAINLRGQPEDLLLMALVW